MLCVRASCLNGGKTLNSHTPGEIACSRLPDSREREKKIAYANWGTTPFVFRTQFCSFPTDSLKLATGEKENLNCGYMRGLRD